MDRYQVDISKHEKSGGAAAHAKLAAVCQLKHFLYAQLYFFYLHLTDRREVEDNHTELRSAKR